MPINKPHDTLQPRIGLGWRLMKPSTSGGGFVSGHGAVVDWRAKTTAPLPQALFGTFRA